MIQIKNDRVGYPTSPGLCSEYRSTQHNAHTHIQQACTYHKIFKEEKDASTTTKFLSVLSLLFPKPLAITALSCLHGFAFPRTSCGWNHCGLCRLASDSFLFCCHCLIVLTWGLTDLELTLELRLPLNSAILSQPPKCWDINMPIMPSSHGTPHFLPFLYISSDSCKCHLASLLSCGLVLVATVATYSSPVCLSYLRIPSMSLDSLRSISLSGSIFLFTTGHSQKSKLPAPPSTIFSLSDDYQQPSS